MNKFTDAEFKVYLMQLGALQLAMACAEFTEDTHPLNTAVQVKVEYWADRIACQEIVSEETVIKDSRWLMDTLGVLKAENDAANALDYDF